MGTNQPIVPVQACATIVEEAERVGEWGARDASRMATELNVAELPETSKLLSASLPDLATLASKALLPQLPAVRWRVNRALIIRYDAGMSNDHMYCHDDTSLVTIIISLNDGFSGGGTWFQALGDIGGATVRVCSTGLACVSAGPLWHGGARTMEGVRYIMTIFLYHEDHVDHAKWMSLNARQVWRESGNINLAIDLFENSVRVNPRDSQAWAMLGHARREKGDLAGAVEALGQAVKLGEEANNFNFIAAYTLGHDLSNLGDYEGAARAFAQALDIADNTQCDVAVSDERRAEAKRALVALSSYQG